MKTMTMNAPVRGVDKWGSGAYLASRGERTHRGVDFACCPGTEILSLTGGKVTKLGYPYNPQDEKKGHYRYVEVTDSKGYRVRYFYVNPAVVVGQMIKAGDALGLTQSLQRAYPDMTNHIHFEVKTQDRFVNPIEYMEQAA